MENTNEGYLFDSIRYSQVVGKNINKYKSEYSGSHLECYYSVVDGEFRTGYNATFGTLNLHGSLLNENIKYLAEKFYQYLSQNYSTYELRLAPTYLCPHIDIFVKNMKELNCNIVNEHNQFQLISSSEPYLNFSKSNRKIYRRLEASGVRVLTSRQPTHDGYDLLNKNRLARGVRLSLTFNELKKQAKLLNDHFTFFSCLNSSNILIAYAVCVEISPSVFYVLYWGEQPAYRKLSPVVFLAGSIKLYCYENNYRWLDAGISSLNGIVDDNLMLFKSRLGFTSCPKYTIRP